MNDETSTADGQQQREVMPCLLIKQCPDEMMWYRDKVGQYVRYLYEDAQTYWSVENAGYKNIVRKEDAELVWVPDADCWRTA